MRKNILVVCILLAICLSVSYADVSFRDGDTSVTCGYMGTKQDYRDWKQTFGDLSLDIAHKNGGRNIHFITKLSNNEVRLINKALQRYEVMKNEIYTVAMVSTNGVVKCFDVLVNSKGQWDFVGIEYSL